MGDKIWGYSKKDVNYRAAKRPETRCDNCKFMFPKLALGTCKIVRGTIKGADTCNEFKPAS